MKLFYNILSKKFIVITLFMLSLTGYGQNFVVFLANGAQPTPNTLEVDIMITITPPAPATCVRLASVAFGVNYDPTILNGGFPCTTPSTGGCGSWTFLGVVTRSPQVAALNLTTNTNKVSPTAPPASAGHLRCTMTNLTGATSIDVPGGTYCLGRYRFTNTVSTADLTPVPFTTNSNASLWMQPTNAGGNTNTIVSFYPCGQTTPLQAYTTILPSGGTGLSLPNTAGNPFSIPLNPCATAATFTTTPVTCFGDTNGTATLTIASFPAGTSVSYTLDGNPTVLNATLNASAAFTISGLAAGTHSVNITAVGSCTNVIAVPNIVITGPAQLTNSTTIAACDSYTWSVTGTAYTTSGTYTGTTTSGGCTVNETLNLTITPSSTNTTTISVCDSYTWANNGQTYTASGTYTGTVTNCVTEQLVLTITPSSTVTTTISACDSYTWSNTGTTYTASGTYTGTITNCVTQQLVLTVTPSSTVTTTISACDSYTWANNGQTYTASGTYTGNTVNCVTQQLVLTITPSSTVTTTIAACGSYTWANNGQTYTTSGTYTGTVTNCVTQQLVLTITPNSTNTTTISVCDTYTWANNGQTYTTSGTYTGTVTNCVTEQLVLTITPSSTVTTTISACDSYTWANNGQTYTASGTYTGTTTNCVTQQLVLTIAPSSTVTTTISACGSYTWANNGQTYTTSGTYTGTTTNCVTQQLVLTITPNSTNTTTISVCSSYTWSNTGITYTTSGTYTGTVTNCVTEQLVLTVSNATSGTTNASACLTYTWALPLGNGQTYTTSQFGLQNVTTNAAGCTHTQTLNLTINTPTTGTTTVAACNSYTWAAPLGNGLTYTTSQTATHVSVNANGCQHTQTLNLTINTNTTGTTTTTACNSYIWALPLGNGQTYTSSVSNVTHISTNAAGCQHTQTLNLTINNTSSGVTNATACNSYVWALPLGNGLTYTSSVSGVTKITTNAAGCPHTQTLNLVINHSTSAVSNVTACNTYTWAAPLGNGQTYTSSVSGVTFVSTNAAGCSHTQTLNLTINSSSTGTTTTTACDSYTWALPFGNGQTYTSSVSGVTHVSTNAFGCPHTQTLNLTINNGSSGTTTATACNSYTWALPLGNGQTYTSSVFGVTKITTNANGCPHVQTLNLTINNSTAGTTTATACNSYTWALPLGNGQTYTTSQSGITNVTTNAAGCTHTQTLNLTINNSTSGTSNITACTSYTWPLPLGNGQTYTSSVSGVTNVTTNAGGCPHTQTLNLTINQNTTNGSVTTTAVNSYTWAANLVTYTASGVYTHVTTTAGGCTNTATLNLTITTVTGTTWYQDLDGDGYGNPSSTVTAPIAPPGYVAIGTDCNDNNPTINPGAIEVCYDGIDNDCNGVIDNVGQPGGCIAIVTSLIQANCGVTLVTLRDKLTAHYVVGAQGYRFRIKNQTNNVVIIRDRPVNFILLSSLPGITYNTTYTVDIALLINNIWQPVYGSACNVTTPTPISTIGSQCGTTLQSMNQWVFATHYAGITGYRFRITNTVDGSVQIKDQVLNRFNFNQLPNRVPSTVYFIEVALKNTDGTYMPYGAGCNVTTSSANRINPEDGNVSDFKVIAYPNPFAENFKLNVSTSSQTAIQIRVYDMLGKQIENRSVKVSEIEGLLVGETYPSGVYNLIVTQGNTTQTVRVIKR